MTSYLLTAAALFLRIMQLGIAAFGVLVVIGAFASDLAVLLAIPAILFAMFMLLLALAMEFIAIQPIQRHTGAAE